MKRFFVIMVVGLVSVSVIGCSQKEINKNSSEAVATDSVVEEQLEDDGAISDEEEISKDTSVDLDLTAMSSTVIYSEVYNMMMEPLAYVGKTVKLQGNCGIYVDEETGKTYYACIVQDATQCCAQGLEFVLDEDIYSQEDYPQEGDAITIKGEFSTYEENGCQYLTIADSEMEKE